MATRATYQINHRGQWKPKTTIYCHWDGYPTGAATYWRKALLAMDSVKGGFAEAFLYGNAESAELTAGHDAHGDTEFRYTVTVEQGGKMLMRAEKAIFCEDFGGGRKGWSTVFEGDLLAFVNEYTAKGYCEQDLTPPPAIVQLGNDYLPLDHVPAWACKKLQELALSHARGHSVSNFSLDGLPDAMELLRRDQTLDPYKQVDGFSKMGAETLYRQMSEAREGEHNSLANLLREASEKLNKTTVAAA